MPHHLKNKSFAMYRFKIIIIFLGVGLIVAWTAIAAILNLSASLPCHYSQSACFEGRHTANIVLSTPLIAGSIILTFGLASLLRIHLALKFIAGAILSVVLSWIAWYVMILAHIFFHGL